MNRLVDLIRKLWDPIATPAGFILAAVVTHLWRRFRNRLVLLRWSAQHTNVALSAADPVLGNVEVLHNGVRVQNLQLLKLYLENESTRDLESVVVNLLYADGTRFLSGWGAIRGSTQGLAFSDAFQRQLANYLVPPAPERDPNLLDWLMTHRDFALPVLNRGSIVDFVFLVNVPLGRLPALQMSCDHRGVQLRYNPPRQALVGVPAVQATLVGWVAGMIVVLLLAFFISGRLMLALVSFVVGAFVMLLGVGLIRGWRLLLKVLS